MSNSLIIREEQTLIEKNLSDSVDYQTLYLNADSDVSDAFLNEITNDLINKKEYNNIFIPLCFGPIMSDFNGLRLAAHIRCTPGFNQNKNIYIFSFVNINQLINHECFDIIKTIGVQLIKYNFYSIQASIGNKVIMLDIDELPKEIKKLNLQVPTNYEDNHSIANEWAIYRWAQVIGAYDDGINKITHLQKSNLYFKYLKTINPISHLQEINQNQLKIKKEDNPKILYIDDEAEKGWFEIFETILYKNNDISFYDLDVEFNEKSREEIIDISLKKIIEEDFDLVILDFRLHKDDFDNSKIEAISGYQILKKIKEHNKGIQVIIFSATNKIWNLQALQNAGADGFIIKESPENSNDSNFTKESILSLVKTIENRLNMIFLKKAYPIIDKIKSNLINISNDNGGKGLEEGLMKIKFKNEIFIQLDIIYDCLEKSSLKISTTIEDQHSYLNLSFISIFKIIELINDFYTDEKGIVLKSNNIEVQMYNQASNTFSSYTNQYPSTRDKIYSIIKFELNDEPKCYVNKLNQFINFRNNIIHPKTLKDYKKTTKIENLEFLKLVNSLIDKMK